MRKVLILGWTQERVILTDNNIMTNTDNSILYNNIIILYYAISAYNFLTDNLRECPKTLSMFYIIIFCMHERAWRKCENTKIFLAYEIHASTCIN